MKTELEYVKHLKSIDYKNTLYRQDDIENMKMFAEKLIKTLCDLNGKTLGDVQYKKEFILEFNDIKIGHNGLVAIVKKGVSSALSTIVAQSLYKASENEWRTGVMVGYEW